LITEYGLLIDTRIDVVKQADDLSSEKIPYTNVYYGYAIVAAAFILQAMGFGIFYSFGVFFDALHLEFGWSRATISGAFSLCSLSTGVLGIMAGRLTDRFGPRVVTTLCSLLLGSGLLLMSGASTLWGVYLVYTLLIGAGVAGFWSPLVSTVARWFVGSRGLMMGIVVCGIGVGTIVMATIASRSISAFGLKNAYLIVGGIVLVVAVLSAQVLRHSPSKNAPGGNSETAAENGTTVSNDSSSYSYGEAFGTPQFWMIISIYFCFGATLHTILVHVVPRAIDTGIDPFRAAGIISLGGGASLLGRIAMGGASDRFGVKKCMLLEIGLISISVFWLVTAGDLWMFHVFAIVHGIGYGGLSALQPLIVAELFGLKAAGMIVGNVSFAFTLGGAIGPFLAGYVFDIMQSYTPTFLSSAILMTFCFVLGYLIKPIARNDSPGVIR